MLDICWYDFFLLALPFVVHFSIWSFSVACYVVMPLPFSFNWCWVPKKWGQDTRFTFYKRNNSKIIQSKLFSYLSFIQYRSSNEWKWTKLNDYQRGELNNEEFFLLESSRIWFSAFHVYLKLNIKHIFLWELLPTSICLDATDHLVSLESLFPNLKGTTSI